MSDPVALQKAKSAYHACVGEDFLDVLGMVDPEVEVCPPFCFCPVLVESISGCRLLKNTGVSL